MNKIGILYHPKVEATHTEAKKLEEFLVSNGVSTWLCSSWEDDKARAHLDDTELLLSVGGDGTILRAAHIAAQTGIPITGINLGKLGFMTELSADEALQELPSLLAGKGWIDERTMLEAELPATDEVPPHTFHALNDVVLARGAIARLVQIEASINQQHLTSYRADGVIVSTATGSTGYSLAAGGPILYPQSRDLLLVPITPHLSPAYAMVLPPTAILKLHIATTYPATLSVDGCTNLSLSDGATIIIKHSASTTRFLRIHPENTFYNSLEKKLKGKQ